MERRWPRLGLWLAIATAPAWVAAEGTENKAGATDPPAAQAPKAEFRGAFRAVRFDVSPPLRSMVPVNLAVPEKEQEREDDDLWGTEGPYGPRDNDPVCQKSVGTGTEIPLPLQTFDAFTNMCNCSPPDSDGDVGLDHYVVMVNVHFAIYTKTGTLVAGPMANNTLWAGFGGACQAQNSGDPVVLYDQLADRWIFTQFTGSAPFRNCLAVSQTGDPGGPYFRYELPVPSNVLPDYPKWGIWPDAYYLSTREVGAGIIGAYAIDRAAVIAGTPTAQIISFAAPVGGAPTGGDGLLPTDMDGTTLPPAGSPNYYVGTMDQGGPYGATQDALVFWRFHVDFTTPSNSTFQLTNTIPVAPFTSVMPAPCSSSRQCIPQPATANRIDHLGYRQRPTFRLAYRNFGTHESLVTAQSVDAGGGMSGMRWYEIRTPGTTPTVFQQGTYAPGLTDTIHRWMGSIAMDRAGNMALGYSASNASVFPSLRYTGRLVTDPLGDMPQGEGILHAGTGSQTTSARWGDYTAMTVDPRDDCTFWYVNQYIPTSSPNGWRIRVGSFRFPDPQCVPVPVELQSFEIKD
ncbi:MAG TPA: hypothetical protein VFQ51_17985 [Vicinamibacteria bacterium]|nr:hypothetical protein [Vicinamibacteria bacterium]